MIEKKMAFTGNDLKKLAYKYPNIYVYGAGKYGVVAVKLLRKNGLEVKSIVVSSKNNNPEELLGVPVVEIDDIKVDNEKNIFILGISQMFLSDVMEVLKGNGHCNIVQIGATQKTQKWKELAKFPKLEITPKIGCSVQCKYCPQDAFCKAYFAENKNRCTLMSFEDYTLCVDKTPDNTIITFAGFVEPFFHPDAVKMIRYAHESGRYVELYTTLVGMTMEMFEQIKDIPFLEVVLHTPDKDGFANIPMTEEYCRVLDRVLEHTKEDGSPFVDSANCQSEPSEHFLEIANGRIEVVSALVDRAGNLADEGLRTAGTKTGKLYCRRSLRQNHWVLLPDCSLVLCCMDFGMKHVIGNLKESSYEDLYKGEEYLQLRRKMLEVLDKNDILCRSCTSAGDVCELHGK